MTDKIYYGIKGEYIISKRMGNIRFVNSYFGKRARDNEFDAKKTKPFYNKLKKIKLKELEEE